MLSDDLLKQADHLATKEPRRPLQASVRRSVSTSYYALFHALSLEFTEIYPKEALAETCRMLDHGTAKAAASDIKRLENAVLLGCAISADLTTIASDFLQLQQLRHEADYDLTRTFSRREALECVERAKRSIGLITKLKRDDPRRLRALVLAFVLKPRCKAR